MDMSLVLAIVDRDGVMALRVLKMNNRDSPTGSYLITCAGSEAIAVDLGRYLVGVR